MDVLVVVVVRLMNTVKNIADLSKASTYVYDKLQCMKARSESE